MLAFFCIKKGQKTDNKIKVEINEKAIEKAKKLAGYNMIITSETRMTASEIYAAYHNLWRIEESFRIMKSQLDARPVSVSYTHLILYPVVDMQTIRINTNAFCILICISSYFFLF